MDPILLEVLRSIAGSIAEKSLDALAKIIGDNEDLTSQDDLAPSLARHLVEVSNWSSRIEFYGLAQAMSTESASVILDMSSTPRKFSGGNNLRDRSEDDLLASNRHILLIGDPGSGKSTTVKRLCQKILSSSPTTLDDTIQYPLLIRLRQLPNGSSIQTAIAEAIGLAWTTSEENENGQTFNKRMVGSLELYEAIIAVLENTQPLICLDGLDEVSNTNRENIEREIEELAQSLQTARILVTTRTGDFTRNISGLDVLELMPLDDSQITKIVELSLENPGLFLEAIKDVTYYDALSRPLALMQAMVLFKNSGVISDQPSDMYGRITELYLEKWDSQNKVERATKYSDFIPKRKMNYLASLAHYLLYKSGEPKIAFSHDDLELAYGQIHQQFGLELKDATLINKEIETHTGILVEAREREFEFAHLSLQEYLAAYYLVMDQSVKRKVKRLQQYPVPIAITLALCVDPVELFSDICLNKDVQANLHRSESALPIFLQRIQDENVYFYRSGILGFAILSLGMAFVHNDMVCDQLEKLMTNGTVSESVSIALKPCKIKSVANDNSILSLKIVRSLEIGDGRILPERGKIQSRLLPKDINL